MRKTFGIYALTTIILASLVTNIFAYPVFSKYTNITSKEVEAINNYNEGELYLVDPPEILNDSDQGTKTAVTVLKLNWFDTVHATFPTYTKTRVIDIYSGLTYYVYRNGGHYHADVEPINQANTDIFYKIYNYNWSWTRRPVWVEIKPDLWVAGSINGYPHGNAYIKNTGMNGHTCIHFLQSKTHGSKRVDEAHQSCVEYAYNHRSEIVNYL